MSVMFHCDACGKCEESRRYEMGAYKFPVGWFPSRALDEVFAVCSGRCERVLDQRCTAALALVRNRAIRVTGEIDLGGAVGDEQAVKP